MGFDILTIDEAAERARVSRRQLNYRLAKGQGPTLTLIGGARRIRSDMLEEWLKRCTAAPTAPLLPAKKV
jgi:excisionase family DNA binding protein